jgi:NADPH:quinone reductase
MTMRAVLVREFGPLEQMAVEEVPEPTLGPGEVLIDVQAAPVNYVDLLTARGEYQFRPALPYIPGKGPAGIVRAVDGAVSGLSPGDRVLAMAEYGGYAQTVAVGHRQVYTLPGSISFADAAAMAVAFDTAWMALRDRARLQPGESVLVLGATGAVGGAAVQLAKAMGAALVLAGVSSPDRWAGAAEAGADACVDLSRADLANSLRDQVRLATDGAGVDVVIDPVGGDAFDGAVRSLAWRGRLVIVGFAAGRIPVLKMNYPLLKNIEISGLQISDYRKRAPDSMAECFRQLFRLVDERRIRPPRHTTVPLTDWRAALEAVQSRRAQSRIVLVPPPRVGNGAP